ncbi:MAG: type II secretion system F family protein [Victivallales bacterium]|nr:type II secretion system F family protein [Victivallales bacterium]
MGAYKDKSNFYSMMATLLEAGVSVPGTLQQPHQGCFARIAPRLAQHVLAGRQLWEAVSSEKVFTPFECSLIKVGEYSGMLPNILRSLSDWFATQHTMRSRIFLSLLYPLFIYHFAVAVFAFVSYIGKTAPPSAILMNMITLFLLPWLLLLLGKVLSKLIPGFVLNLLPVVGDLLFKLETAFYFKVLGLSLGAGVSAFNSLSLSADCCNTAFYRKRYGKVADIVKTYSCSISEAFNNGITFRERQSPIPALLASAEVSGTLPDACERISKMQLDAATLRLALLSKAVPTLLYIGTCVYIAYRIILFYKGYFDQIKSLL